MKIKQMLYFNSKFCFLVSEPLLEGSTGSFMLYSYSNIACFSFAKLEDVVTVTLCSPHPIIVLISKLIEAGVPWVSIFDTEEIRLKALNSSIGLLS